MKNIIAIVLISVALYSCNKTSSLPAYNYDPVISAYLHAGHVFSIQLSAQQSASSQTYTSPSLDTLQVTITTADSSYQLTPMGKGIYTDSNLIITAGTTYNLSFNYNGKKVTASTTIPAKPTDFAQSATTMTIAQITSTSTVTNGPGNMVTPIELTWDNTYGDYYVVVVECIQANPEKIFDTISTSTDTGRVFRNTPITTATYDINSRSFKYFGAHRIVLYHILPDYALLYDNSSLSAQSLATPSTGITNGVGLFTGITSDTLYMTVVKQ